MRALLRPAVGRVALLGALALALAASGCKRDESSAKKADEGSETAAEPDRKEPIPAKKIEPAAAPTIKLIEQGSDPLRKLRYDYQEDRDEAVAMDIAMTVEIIVPGLPSQPVAVPGLRLGMHLRTTEVTSEGAHYTFELTQAEILGQEDSPPMLLDSMQSARDQLLALRGEGIVDTQGVSRSLQIDPGAGLREDTVELVDSAKRSLNQMSAPLPSAPVGVGAIWEVRQTLLESGVVVEQVSQIELLKIDGNNLELEMSIAQTGAKQAVQFPGAPDGEDLTLNSLRGNGTATLRISLDSFVPAEAKIAMERHSEILRDGRSTTMVLSSQIDLTRAE